MELRSVCVLNARGICSRHSVRKVSLVYPWYQNKTVQNSNHLYTFELCDLKRLYLTQTWSIEAARAVGVLGVLGCLVLWEQTRASMRRIMCDLAFSWNFEVGCPPHHHRLSLRQCRSTLLKGNFWGKFASSPWTDAECGIWAITRDTIILEICTFPSLCWMVTFHILHSGVSIGCVGGAIWSKLRNDFSWVHALSRMFRRVSLEEIWFRLFQNLILNSWDMWGNTRFGQIKHIGPHESQITPKNHVVPSVSNYKSRYWKSERL